MPKQKFVKAEVGDVECRERAGLELLRQDRRVRPGTQVELFPTAIALVM